MEKILVANRGEIALRIMKTARDMGIKTVAVYSEADRTSPHVIYADEAVCVGPPPSSESYLRMDEMIRVALELGVDGIHPGYGFLSENAVFAEKVSAAGMIFIGPSSEAIRVMGSKLEAKNAVKSYDCPLVPGTEEAIDNRDEARAIAREIGYPILIKASAGGGGKGMRIVHRDEDFNSQMDLAVSEAVSAFGDGAVFIEKYVAGPRHIEIQILADTHGHIVHLFERECSVQRRHQKVVEEAPSAVLTPELRAAMGKSAVDVARACNYVGAGTVEFLVDEQLNYYFLEMNTRLQVEHPVTEMITGLDLVEEQIRIARGEALRYTQDNLKILGHAVEVRVYAENPQNDFLPDIGRLQTYRRPHGPGVRVDDGFEEGMDVPIYYDPMISKLITYGRDRDQAIRRMVRAIDDYEITGLHTTLSFCKMVMQHEAFLSGNFDTHFVQKYFEPADLESPLDDRAQLAATFAASRYEKTQKNRVSHPADATRADASAWRKNRR